MMAEHRTELGDLCTRAFAAKNKPGIDGAGVIDRRVKVGDVIPYYTYRDRYWWEFWKRSPVVQKEYLEIDKVIIPEEGDYTYYEGSFINAKC